MPPRSLLPLGTTHSRDGWAGPSKLRLSLVLLVGIVLSWIQVSEHQPPLSSCPRWPHCPPEPAGCPPCLFGDWAQRRCSDRVLGARPVLTAGAAGCGCLLVPMRQRCIFALSGHCGWPPVWTSDAPTLGLLALAVAFGGGACAWCYYQEASRSGCASSPPLASPLLCILASTA